MKIIIKDHLLDLAKGLDFDSEIQYFDYIVGSLINGQRQQVKKLFAAMLIEDQKEFLFEYIDNDSLNQNEVYIICIDVLFDTIEKLTNMIE